MGPKLVEPTTNMASGQSSKHLAKCTVDLVKGYTKASVIAFTVMAVAELDLEKDWDKILPFTEFLDRAWMLPTHDSRLKLKFFALHCIKIQSVYYHVFLKRMLYIKALFFQYLDPGRLQPRCIIQAVPEPETFLPGEWKASSIDTISRTCLQCSDGREEPRGIRAGNYWTTASDGGGWISQPTGDDWTMAPWWRSL